MSESTTAPTRTTYKYTLKPTPQQEAALAEVVWRCRALDNTALEQRRTWWGVGGRGRGQGQSPTRYAQEAELKAIRAEMADYAALHSHVVQEVLARLDQAFHAFFRRIQAGEKAGYPRFHGTDR
jgi:putative transposase